MAKPTAGGGPAAGLPASDPKKPLDLPGPGKVLVQVAGKTGSEQVAVVPRVERGTLGAVVVCNGPGELTVDLGTVASFRVACGAGSPGVYNEIVLGSPRSRVPVLVQGSSENTWALTLGWDDAQSIPQ